MVERVADTILSRQSGRTDLLLHVEPSNRQAQSLKGLIDTAETKEGYIGKSSPRTYSLPTPFFLCVSSFRYEGGPEADDMRSITRAEPILVFFSAG